MERPSSPDEVRAQVRAQAINAVISAIQRNQFPLGGDGVHRSAAELSNTGKTDQGAEGARRTHSVRYNGDDPKMVSETKGTNEETLKE